MINRALILVLALSCGTIATAAQGSGAQPAVRNERVVVSNTLAATPIADAVSGRTAGSYADSDHSGTKSAQSAESGEQSCI